MTQDIDTGKLQEFIDKIDTLKKDNKLDLSSDQDLSIALMNLISLEEHFFFSGSKTNDPTQFDLLKEVRVMRKELMGKLVKKGEGENWCISKHLLAASMRLMEVGTKALDRGNKTESDDLFAKAYNLYSLFWGLNMDLINTTDIKKIDDGALDKNDAEKKGFLGKLGVIVKKAVDCCLE